MMKLFGTIYTSITTEQLAQQISLSSWSCEKKDVNEYVIIGKGVNVSLEGNGEILLFGELSISIQAIEEWVAIISKLKVSYNIDIHADEARLVRRFQQ